MIGRLAAIPLMLVSLAASAEDRQITLKNLLGDDPVTTQPCSPAAMGNAACGSSADFPLGGSGIRQPPPPLGWTYMSGVDNPMIAVLGAGGCIVGPFKLFNHGQTILEIPLGVEYPAGCRERK